MEIWKQYEQMYGRHVHVVSGVEPDPWRGLDPGPTATDNDQWLKSMIKVIGCVVTEKSVPSEIDQIFRRFEDAPDAPRPLVLKEGRWYRQADGTVVGPMCRNDDQHFRWGAGGRTYTKHGRYYGSSVPSILDLIEEVPAPILWESKGAGLHPTVDDRLIVQTDVDFKTDVASLFEIYVRCLNDVGGTNLVKGRVHRVIAVNLETGKIKVEGDPSWWSIKHFFEQVHPAGGAK